MSLVASFFKPEQHNPFGFLTRESYTSIGSTLYSTAGEIKAEDKDVSSKADALMSNATCYMTFDKRGLTVYKDTSLLYTVPGIKSIKIVKDGDKFYLYMDGNNVSKKLLDPVQQHANDYYYFNQDGLTLTSYGDLIMVDKEVWSEDNKSSKKFQTKNFSLARYYLAIVKRVINVSNYETNWHTVPKGADVVSWDTSKGNFIYDALSFNAQSDNHIWAVLRKDERNLNAFTSDNIDTWTLKQWDYKTLSKKNVLTVDKMYVASDGIYIGTENRANSKGLQNVTTVYFCLDGDLILCDNAGTMLWSLYVECATVWMDSKEYIPDYDINQVYTVQVISAVNEYNWYLTEFKKAEANYKIVDSRDGVLKNTQLATNSLSVMHANGEDTYFETFYEKMAGLTKGTSSEVYKKLKENTSLNSVAKFGSVTNPVKFIRGNPNSTSANSEGKKLESEVKKLKEKREAADTITNSIVKSYKIPFPLISLSAGKTTNKNPATLLIKDARLYSGGSVTEYTDVTGLVGAWASVKITNADKLKEYTFMSKSEWENFIQAIHSRPPESGNTLKVTYELNGQKETISTTDGTLSFGSGINVNCKIDWSKCVNSLQTYQIVAYPFGEKGTACPADLPVSNTRTCVNDPVNCVGGWGSFSSCVNGTQTKRYTITTPAAYGGTPCLGNNEPDYITQNCTDPSSNTHYDSKSYEEDDKEESFWEKYKWYIIGGGSAFLLVIIAVIMVFVLKKKPAPPV